MHDLIDVRVGDTFVSPDANIGQKHNTLLNTAILINNSKIDQWIRNFMTTTDLRRQVHFL